LIPHYHCNADSRCGRFSMSSHDQILTQVSNAAKALLSELQRIEPLDLSSEDHYPSVVTALDRCLARLAALGIWGSENRLPSSELWNVAGHLLSRGWLQNQARTKPRGYAGDYETLARIYENRLCDDPLGRLFDRYFQEQAAPRAVRNRMGMIADWIVDAAIRPDGRNATEGVPYRVAIVGSAFGLEVRDALRRLSPSQRDNVHVTLIDVDPAAIEFARGQLSPLLAENRLTAISTNLFRLPERPQEASLLAGSDLLFCPGLFDYLEDSAAIAMLRALYEQLHPGGRLTIFQFAPHNPTRTYMEWIANWYLIYRNAEQFRRLVDSAGLLGAECAVGAESLGVDVYAAITRAA
jgi:extracellular factor (EF) 3-hydroxypalmitic acid methyl ester biosynthesis protein